MNNFASQINRNTGPFRRLVLAFLALFSPGDLVMSVFKGLLEGFDELTDEELRSLFRETPRN